VADNSYKLAAFPLAILALLSLPKTINAFQFKKIRTSAMALLSYFIVSALSVIINGGDASNLDMPSRVIIASCILCLVYSYPPSVRFLMFSICVGAISSGVVAIYQSIDSGGRAFIHHGYMVIQAGGIASALSVLSIVTFLYAVHHRDKTLQIAAVGAVIFSLIAVLLSGARGSWVPLPFILLGLFIYHRNMLSMRTKLYSVVTLCLIIAFSYSNIKPRLESAVDEVISYQNDNAATSSGARLEMWKSSLYSGLDKPIFGQGFDGVIEAKKTQVSEGLVDKIVLKYNRAHNQFFEELQTKGLIGLATILFFFWHSSISTHKEI
jgi:O-antigen ligase